MPAPEPNSENETSRDSPHLLRFARNHAAHDDSLAARNQVVVGNLSMRPPDDHFSQVDSDAGEDVQIQRAIEESLVHLAAEETPKDFAASGR